MRIGILSTLFEINSQSKEVEEDLTQVGMAIKNALEANGHEAAFHDVNEGTFEELRKDRPDMVFNVCERFNGSSFFEPHIASMLELMSIPYTGSGPWALALCMNKIRVKEILHHHNVPTPEYQVMTNARQKLAAHLKFPVIVKPAFMDNSIGITKDSVVNDEEGLQKQARNILKTYSQPVLVEEYLGGREFTVGIIGNELPFALPIAETLFDSMPEGLPKILTYDAKWYRQSQEYQGSPTKCPAEISPELEAAMKELALKCFSLLGIKDYGRIDFRLDASGRPHVLEMNPNPGMNTEDFIPAAAAAMGITYNELIALILKEAAERYSIKTQAEEDGADAGGADEAEK